MSDVSQSDNSKKYKANKLRSFFLAGFYAFLIIIKSFDHTNSYLLSVFFLGFVLVFISFGLNPKYLAQTKDRFNLKTMPKPAQYWYCIGLTIILSSVLWLIVETFAPQFFS